MAKAIDKMIIELVCGGSDSREEGYRLLLEHYQQRLYWHIRRIVVSHEDAEDALQESLVNIFRNVSKFRAESSLFTWMYRIATNEALRVLRSRKVDNVDFEKAESFLISTLHEQAAYTPEEIVVRFQAAILQLPERQRVVFNMRYYDEMPYEDMAQVLDSTVENMKTNYHYASKKIKEIMSK